MKTFCFVTIEAALFLFKTISAIKCCSRWELICFLSRVLLLPEESGVDRQNYVVLRVTVSDPPQICTCPPHPLSIVRYQQRLHLHGLLDFVSRLHGFICGICSMEAGVCSVKVDT